MKGHVSSLNAAVAGSILMYEASSQRGGGSGSGTSSGRAFRGASPNCLRRGPAVGQPPCLGSPTVTAWACRRRHRSARSGANPGRRRRGRRDARSDRRRGRRNGTRIRRRPKPGGLHDARARARRSGRGRCQTGHESQTSGQGRAVRTRSPKVRSRRPSRDSSTDPNGSWAFSPGSPDALLFPGLAEHLVGVRFVPCLLCEGRGSAERSIEVFRLTGCGPANIIPQRPGALA